MSFRLIGQLTQEEDLLSALIGPGVAGPLEKRAECLSRQMRADVSSPLSCNHLLSSRCAASFLCPVCAHMHKHTRYTVSAQSWKHVCTKKKLTLQIFSTVNLIVWVFWLADSIINLISSSSKQLFSSEALINPLHATCLATTPKHKV